MVDMALLSHPQSQTEDLKSTAEAQQAVRHINQLKNLRLICASQYTTTMHPRNTSVMTKETAS